VAALGLGAAAAALAARTPEPSVRLASVLYTIDAGVVTRPLPVCDAAPRSVTVLREGGAHPALTPDDRFVYFDAPSPADGGRRQIHRLERSSGEQRCITCGQPGYNVRPSVNAAGIAMVFESDRDASWRRPDETELYLAGIATRTDAPDPGRRLSFSPGPDAHPVFGPGPQMVTWSRRTAGRYQVVAATIRSGHGGILLGKTGVLAEGGAQWIAPVAWSADARRLLVARGNPFAALRAVLRDPVEGESEPIAEEAALAGATNGDGAWLALATARSRHAAGVAPRVLGFALAPWAHATALREPLRQHTGLRVGPIASPAEAAQLALPDDVADWGEPAGLAFASDASGIALAQRRAGAEPNERLLWIELACSQLATAPREPVAAR
ncbi:MAG: hypothetical protein DCC71_24390, partial [Proteobacteria bacterium]